MTEEEYFRKNYPDSCYGDRLLSPYWDYFQDGVEFGERQSENKIADIKANCDLAIEGRDIKIMELKDHLAEEVELHLHAEKYIKSLEKENAELKSELTKKADTNHSLVEQMAKLEEENAELQELKKKKEEIEIMTNFCKTCKKIHTDQLTKAIGIIKRWYETNRSACIEPSQELIEVTEQFLKEIEKEKMQIIANCSDKEEGLRRKIFKLEQQIEKLKADLNEAIEDANRWEETETFSVLNRIYNDNFEVTIGVSN